MRVVIDTNILISAALVKDSVPRKVLTHIMRFCTPVISPELLSEYSDALSRPDFDHYTPLEKRLILLEVLERGSEVVRITGRLRKVRDPKDDIVLETALKGVADVLVTGDKDLLVLRPLKRLDIVTAREYVIKYGGTKYV